MNKGDGAVSAACHEYVHGCCNDIQSGCTGKELREFCAQFDWGCSAMTSTGHFKPGHHTPVEFVFWNLNELAPQGQHQILGKPNPARPTEDPSLLVDALGPAIEAGNRMIDDAVARAKSGVIQIFYVGGDRRCWASPDNAAVVDPIWTDVATLVRAKMNQRLQRSWSGQSFPNVMILDGSNLFRKLVHPNGDAYHFLLQHPTHRMEKGGSMVQAGAHEIVWDHMLKAARLAAYLFCQPAGGSAVTAGRNKGRKARRRARGGRGHLR